MRTLLVLGSKPDPLLPPHAAVDAVACANASGFSAARHGFPVPTFTVISIALTSGQAAARQSLQALAGLQTETLYLLPRPAKAGSVPRRALRTLRDWRTSSTWFRWRLRSAGYRWDQFEMRPRAYYLEMVRDLCGQDAGIVAQTAHKHPSTGVVALVLGLARGDYERVVLSGFSFELSHAYGENPEITERETQVSKHAETDIAVMHHLARRHGNLFTTEPTVAERAGLPLLKTD